MVLEEIIKYGKKMVERNLVEGNMGNMSVKLTPQLMAITKTGALMDEIDETIFVNLNEPDIPTHASSEAIVHKSIYNNTEAHAIIHTHSIFATIESIYMRRLMYKSVIPKIIPEDIEGRHILQAISIVEGENGSETLAYNVSKELKANKGVIVYGHGVFAIGNNIKEAFINATLIEHSCKIKYFLDNKSSTHKTILETYSSNSNLIS